MNPSVRAWTNGFSTANGNGRKSDLHYGSELSGGTQVCPDCDVIRTPREFQGIGETFLNCAVCRSRGKPERRKR